MSVESLLPNEVIKWWLSLWPNDESIAIFTYFKHYELGLGLEILEEVLYYVTANANQTFPSAAALH